MSGISDLGAEGQVTDEMVEFLAAVIGPAGWQPWERLRSALEGALALSPLSRRVERLEAAIAAHRHTVEGAGVVLIGDTASQRAAEAKHSADTVLWALLKDGGTA